MQCLTMAPCRQWLHCTGAAKGSGRTSGAEHLRRAEILHGGMNGSIENYLNKAADKHALLNNCAES